MITSKRERYFAVRTIPESVDGYDWAPFRIIYRVWRWRGHAIWWKTLARRQEDQYYIIHRAFRA